MKYVNVVVIAPDRREYDAEVNPDAPDEVLISELVKELKLPTIGTDGTTEIEYAANLIGGMKIKEGTTIQLYELPAANVKALKPRKPR